MWDLQHCLKRTFVGDILSMNKESNSQKVAFILDYMCKILKRHHNLKDCPLSPTLLNEDSQTLFV